MDEAPPVSAEIHIDAPPDVVFEYFTKPEAMVSWMGEYARLEPRSGGVFEVDVRGAAVRGRFLELAPPHHLRFSWGFAGSDTLPPGASVVEVSFVAVAGGTAVTLRHTGIPPEETRDHARGWPHFLDRLRRRAAGGDLGPGASPDESRFRPTG
jgi:uncharacterized protein YndB with AHSA1/START domain